MGKLKICILLVFFFCHAAIHAQSIKGKIIQSVSGEPISNASIYFDGTMRGTSSDKDGNFELRSTGNNKIPIMITAVGFKPVNLSDYSLEKTYEIKMEPRTVEMKEVVISYDGMSMEEKIKIFKEEFLGRTANALNCKIENIDDVNFEYSKRTRTLTATCDNPIVVTNKALGYTLQYTMDNFSVSPFLTGFGGKQLFSEEDNVAENKKIVKARDNTYKGSMMHFIRLLWMNNIERSDFAIFSLDNTRLRYEDIVLENGSEKYLYIKRPIRIVYKQNWVTQLSQDDLGPVYIDRDGFVATGITRSGAMGTKRVGDMLPLEYGLETGPLK